MDLHEYTLGKHLLKFYEHFIEKEVALDEFSPVSGKQDNTNLSCGSRNKSKEKK